MFISNLGKQCTLNVLIMKITKKILLGLIIFLGLFFLFTLWYDYTYKMDVVESYEINSANFPKKVLIASQGSEFKNAVVAGVIDSHKTQSVYFKVIDVTLLENINVNDWNALIILHTWEIMKPPFVVQDFIEINQDKLQKIIVVSTSAEGTFKIEEVDAFTGASIIEEIPDFIEKVNTKLAPLLMN